MSIFSQRIYSVNTESGAVRLFVVVSLMSSFYGFFGRRRIYWDV